MNRRLRDAITVTVTLVWAITMSAGLFIEGYSPPIYVNGAFMVVIGALAYSYRTDVDRERRRQEAEDDL